MRNPSDGLLPLVASTNQQHLTMERYQLSLNAENLTNLGGVFRVSSPYAEVEIVDGPNKGTKLGRTEHIWHTLNPDWAKIFCLDASPDVIVRFQVTIWDYRGENRDPILMGQTSDIEVISVYQQKAHRICEELDGRGRYVWIT